MSTFKFFRPKFSVGLRVTLYDLTTAGVSHNKPYNLSDQRRDRAQSKSPRIYSEQQDQRRFDRFQQLADVERGSRRAIAACEDVGDIFSRPRVPGFGLKLETA
jgi:hypothetical protein